MKPERIIELYNHDYARNYDEKFLHSNLSKQDTQFEVQTIKSLLSKPLLGRGKSWLDVACGTGYFLSLFPKIERAGLDLSPAMLETAKKRNPEIALRQGNYLEDIPEWHSKWDLVTCMWYAYTLVDTIEDVKRLIRNLARWTSARGCCLLPLCDPALVSGVNIPYRIDSEWAGEVTITGITWSYREGPNEFHENLVAPQVGYLIELFKQYFEQVDVIQYPTPRAAIIARRKIMDAD